MVVLWCTIKKKTEKKAEKALILPFRIRLPCYNNFLLDHKLAMIHIHFMYSFICIADGNPISGDDVHHMHKIGETYACLLFEITYTK